MPNSVRGARALLLPVAIGVATLCGCQEGTAPDAARIAPFIEMARAETCAGRSNRLFVIDRTLVFWDRAGDCPDNSYAHRLYRESPDRLVCDSHDSIAGPQGTCTDASLGELFTTITQNLDRADLGLGPGHTVRPIRF